MGTETPVLDVPRQVLSSWRDRSRGAVACCGIPHRAEFTARPILEGVAGYLDCRLAAAHEAGDHVIYVGEVLALGYDRDVEPLLFHGGAYCKVVRN